MCVSVWHTILNKRQSHFRDENKKVYLNYDKIRILKLALVSFRFQRKLFHRDKSSAIISDVVYSDERVQVLNVFEIFCVYCC